MLKRIVSVVMFVGGTVHVNVVTIVLKKFVLG